MRLLKPSWVNHKGKPIFSVDIHPDGTRFATGGQGEDSGKIVIWNVAPVREESAEKDENIPKVLCQMDNHLACVNCVRWANNGRFLASCGDDKLIMIWQCSRSGGVSSSFGSGGSMVNLEHWRCASTLTGHTGDVLDLAWSPQDVWLASCSIDNTVVIWNAHKFPEQISVLRGHTSLVKGVTWDPVGKYVASQSDDKSLRIWRTLDWQQDACVTAPFQECGGTTHVLRLNWSPDGHYLVSAHAMNNSGPTAQIITRQGWKTDMDFVGHRKAITSVRFNPRIFSKEVKKGSGKKQQYTCCAIGSRDRSISVWPLDAFKRVRKLTALKRPLVVTHDLFKNSIMDSTWSKCGLELICCSWDGTVAYMDFTEEEIGKPLSADEVNKLHQKLYGKSVSLSNGSGPQIIESTAMLKLQQQQLAQKKEDEAKQQQTQNGMFTPKKIIPGAVPLTPGTPDTPSKQIETKTKDGRRRIQPIFLAPPPDMGEGPLPFMVNTNFTSTTDRSQIVVEKQSAPPTAMEGAGDTMANTSVVEVASMQPMSALESKPAEKRKSSNDTPTEKSSAYKEQKEHKHKKRKEDKDKTLLAKRKLDIEKVKKHRKKNKDRLSTSSLAVPIPVEKEVTTKIVYATSGIQLPVPDIERLANIQVTGEESNLEIENGISAEGSILNRIRCTKDGLLTWENLLSHRIIAASGSSRVSAVACCDQSLSLFSQTGRRLVTSLVLESAISKLHTAGYFVMVVTTQGNVYVWNSQTLKAVISKESLTSIIPTDEITLSSCSLTETGVPILTLSNSKSYTYSTNMSCWLLLSDQLDAMQSCSDHSSFTSSGPPVRGPLASIQTHRSRASFQASRLHRSNPGGQHSATVSHLENQVSAAVSMQSPTEYKYWFLAYVRCLVHENMEDKLREICDDLLGPMYKSKNSQWTSYIMTLKKRELLQEVLPIVGSNLSLQRLFTEYHEQLDTLVGQS